MKRCRVCGFVGELAQFASKGEGKRRSVCYPCWEKIRHERFANIEIPVGEESGGGTLDFMSLELSPEDFERVLTAIQGIAVVADSVIDGFREVGFVPYMERRPKTQMVYRK